jgi:antitoxin (DNA-binding transcriptional repressor) of toxin-antitoxin stability system
LDDVERGGESYVVVRHGRVVATIGPASGATGRALKEALRVNRPDDAWAGELRELRDGIEPIGNPWRD